MATDLLGDRLDGRLPRGRQRRFRPGGTRQRTAQLHKRPPAAGGHLPLRAPDVPDDAVLGDYPHGARPAVFRPGVHRHLAGSREDRVLRDTRIGVERQDTDRTDLRSRHGPATEVGHRARHDSGGARTWPGKPSRPGWSTNCSYSWFPSSSEAASELSPTLSARIWNYWTRGGSQAVLSTNRERPPRTR